MVGCERGTFERTAFEVGAAGSEADSESMSRPLHNVAAEAIHQSWRVAQSWLAEIQ